MEVENTRISWSAEMTEVLLETLKQQQIHGKQSDTRWKSEAWNSAREAVRQKSKYRENTSIIQLRVKVNNLKLLWREWVKLEKASRFE